MSWNCDLAKADLGNVELRRSLGCRCLLINILLLVRRHCGASTQAGAKKIRLRHIRLRNARTIIKLLFYTADASLVIFKFTSSSLVTDFES